MTGAPRQFAAPRASFNDIISIGELIKSVKEGNVGIKKIAEKERLCVSRSLSRP